MPQRARIVIDLLCIKGRVFRIVRCKCGDGHALGLGPHPEACARCGEVLDDAEPS
ncbi:MAG: hypothetical protein JWM74_4693 [Myxococcaceae bacterium]|nr:hypothetical protein [Myxococcaceae bacterium]